ncbi:hypothetical protein [Solibacillus sp. FSL H8-0538]
MKAGLHHENSVRMARMTMEIFAVTAGWLLHGPIGVTTVVLA